MFDTQEVLRQFGIQPIHAGACSGPGRWSATGDRALIDAVNPADATVTSRVAGANALDYEAVMAAAVATQRSWRMVPAPRRGELVLRIGQLADEHLEGLAAVVALDTGKSLMEARSEVKELVDMATFAAGQSRMLYGSTQQSQRA